MNSAPPLARKALMLRLAQGRSEPMGRMHAVFISLNVPAGFELAIPNIVEWLAGNPLGNAGG